MPRCVLPNKDEKPAASYAIPITTGAALPQKGTSSPPSWAGAVLFVPDG